MLEVGDGGDLAKELGDPDAADRLGRDDLHGDGAAVARVAGKVDGAHAALAQLGIDQVAIGDRAAKIDVGPGRDPGLDLEQLVEGKAEHLEHPLPGLGRGIRMLAVDDLGPVARAKARA